MYEIIRKCRKELADSVQEEIINYIYDLDEGTKPNKLRTNKELSKEYGVKLKRRPYSNRCISQILIKYLPKNLRLFRESELKYHSHLIIKFKTREENSINGRTGAYETNRIRTKKKKLKEMLLMKKKHKEITFSKL